MAPQRDYLVAGRVRSISACPVVVVRTSSRRTDGSSANTPAYICAPISTAAIGAAAVGPAYPNAACAHASGAHSTGMNPTRANSAAAGSTACRSIVRNACDSKEGRHGGGSDSSI